MKKIKILTEERFVEIISGVINSSNLNELKSFINEVIEIGTDFHIARVCSSLNSKFNHLKIKLHNKNLSGRDWYINQIDQII